MCVSSYLLLSATVFVCIISASSSYPSLHPQQVNRPGHEDSPSKRLSREAQLGPPNIDNRYFPQFGQSNNQFNGGFNWNDAVNGRNRGRSRRPANPDAIVFRDYDDDFAGPNLIPPAITRATTPVTPSSTVAIPGMETTRSACEDDCQITSQYNPVCGSDTLTYSNMARLTCAQNCGKRVRLLYHGSCTRIRN